MTTSSTNNVASNPTQCSKCGHDAFNGRYCEADDPAYQTRKVPCGCVCRFSVASNHSLESFLRAARELQKRGLLWSSEAAEELGGEPFDPAQQALEVAYILHRALDSRVSDGGVVATKYADGYCAQCSELAYPLTRALEKTGVPTGADNWQQTYGPNKVRALADLETCLRRLLNAIEEGKPEEIKSRIQRANHFIEFHAAIRRRLTAQAQDRDAAPPASPAAPKEEARDLIAFKWAETLSAGEQSVLLASSLKRLQAMIDAPFVVDKQEEPSCWHCGVVLAYAPKLRCEDCPDECDVEGCDELGCAETVGATVATTPSPDAAREAAEEIDVLLVPLRDYAKTPGINTMAEIIQRHYPVVNPEVIARAAAIEISRAIIDGLPVDDKGAIAAIIQRYCFPEKD